MIWTTSTPEWRHTPNSSASGTTDHHPIDHRYVDGDPISKKGTPSTTQHVWLRANGKLPDDPVLHACIVTYASDMTLLDTTVLPFGLSWDSPGMQMASLDHAMWFHRPFRADEWLLYDQAALFFDRIVARTCRRLDLHGRRETRRERRAGRAGTSRAAVTSAGTSAAWARLLSVAVVAVLVVAGLQLRRR